MRSLRQVVLRDHVPRLRDMQHRLDRRQQRVQVGERNRSMMNEQLAQLRGLAIVVEGILRAMPREDLETVQNYVRGKHRLPHRISRRDRGMALAEPAVDQACGIVASVIAAKRELPE